MEPMTQEQVNIYLRSARDSVWVVTDTLAKLAAGATPSEEHKGNLERNISHLEIVIANEFVQSLGGDISDLTSAIADGKAKLAEDIWV